MRKKPLDGDSLFFIDYRIVDPATGSLLAVRDTTTFARNWVEASHMGRHQYGLSKVAYVRIVTVYTVERLADGSKRNTFHYNPPLAHEYREAG